MTKRSAGRVALITGGARGIGAATTERLAEDGAAIAICDLDGAGAAATAAQIASRHAVAPGFIDSDMTRAVAIRLGRDPEEFEAERAKAIPVGSVEVPRDAANVIAFLANEDASFVSGQVIYVAGGPRG